MTAFVKTIIRCGLIVAVVSGGVAAASENPSDMQPQTDKPAVVQPVSLNGYSCDMVRAKVAESGVTAAYAYARYMGVSSRDIARIRKACAV